MKLLCIVTSCFFSSLLFAQRPATQAETNEDARVLKILSEAMPHDLEDADLSERTSGSSNLGGISGFHSDANFATRDVFTHQYTISYQYTSKPPKELKEKIEAAKAKGDLLYVIGASQCDIEIWVNSNFTPDNYPYSLTPVRKINKAYCQQLYRDAAGSDFTFLYFGNRWDIKPNAYDAEDENGKPQKRYSLNATLKTHPGTDVQGIMIYVKGNADLADIILEKTDWQKIKSLIGTGKIKDDESESALKKYFIEKQVAPVAGNNSLSFTYVDAEGQEKQFTATSAAHDLRNCAQLRNHNENPKVLQDAHINFSIYDDKDPNILFNISLPVIRTTGTVTATYQSDYDYQVMWRGNPDVNHSFSPDEITINLTKWAPVGDFMEGTFSGTATISHHNDFSADKPKYIIKNGKFRIRRIADQIR